ncbi:hypothetical protein LCGC14_2082920 [marine sediment metagenome]|uniref:Glycosyltransferase subfamily 4-like N-terminal domain-containing protein n=1 Tax=marine sediment metagenome TaxID=412755 RepID=A0A0F9EFA1_9ZZZZ
MSAARHIVIINDASVAQGGATMLAIQSAQLLRRRGLEVTFVCGDRGENESLIADGIRVIALGGERLETAPRSTVALSAMYNRRALAMMRGMIAEVDGPRTVYHVHGWAQILSPAVFDALAPVARRCFVHAHDYFLACPNGGYFDFQRSEGCPRQPLSPSCLVTACDRSSNLHKAWRLARTALLRRTFHRIEDWAAVLMINEEMREKLQRGGVAPHLLRELRNPARRLTPERVRVEQNGTFCFLGRPAKGKGLGLLLAAAREVGVQVKVIGDMSSRPDLLEAYPEVMNTGWIPQSELAPHLQDIRALVLPSRSPEPFGLVLAEAACAGLPLVVSDSALLSTGIEAQELGLSFKANSQSALAEALRKMADMPAAVIAKISRNGFLAQHSLACTHEAWIEQLVVNYDAAVSPTSAVPA